MGVLKPSRCFRAFGGTPKAHDKACAVAGLDVTLHGLRRSFASLCRWIEMPAGISAQIQGHKPQGVREQHYIRGRLTCCVCGTSK
jgi:integrase